MRLWSIHPHYLDSKGLVALWREGLLAQKVLQGQTRAYTNHPQLARFKTQKRPVAAIASYLYGVYKEAQSRGYRFDKNKIDSSRIRKKIQVTQGQIDYEWIHLMNKLKVRDPQHYQRLSKTSNILPHDLFEIVPGVVEKWEVI
jgi:hypothetical protein